jgi:diadenosine tetraphosphate (Ap4A) HIT family hydrolase
VTVGQWESIGERQRLLRCGQFGLARRHVASLYELSAAEQNSVWELVARVREQLLARLAPDGFNIGLNDGPAAGQTVAHAHVHVIPRWKGDISDPRGGVRWVLPAKATYWKE